MTKIIVKKKREDIPIKCPIADVSNFWTRASIDLIQEGIKRAQKNEDIELLRSCKKRLLELENNLS